MSRLDHKKQFQLEPYQQSEILTRYAQINPADCEKQIHIVTNNGEVMRGADAMLVIWSKTGHWSSFFASIFRIPPFIWLARPLYRLIAKYRKSIYD